MRIEDVVRKMRRSGHKITPQRITIVKAMLESEGLLTPADLLRVARRVDPMMGEVTVYRTVNILSQLGLVCTVPTTGNAHGYVVRPNGHHDHLICSGCGKVVDFKDCNVSALERRLASDTGFVIKEHRLDLYGLCPKCA